MLHAVQTPNKCEHRTCGRTMSPYVYTLCRIKAQNTPMKRLSNHRNFRYIVYNILDRWSFPDKCLINRMSDLLNSDLSKYTCILYDIRFQIHRGVSHKPSWLYTTSYLLDIAITTQTTCESQYWCEMRWKMFEWVRSNTAMYPRFQLSRSVVTALHGLIWNVIDASTYGFWVLWRFSDLKMVWEPGLWRPPRRRVKNKPGAAVVYSVLQWHGQVTRTGPRYDVLGHPKQQWNMRYIRLIEFSNWWLASHWIVDLLPCLYAEWLDVAHDT